MLSRKQICKLRGLAHHLSPAVQMGKAGYADSLVNEVNRNLSDHELIKVRLSADDAVEFESLAEQLAGTTKAALVQTIGRVAVLYRPSEKAKIKV
jgi:RNA-binding protein